MSAMTREQILAAREPAPPSAARASLDQLVDDFHDLDWSAIGIITAHLDAVTDTLNRFADAVDRATIAAQTAQHLPRGIAA